MKQQLYFYPTANEFRKLTIAHDYDANGDDLSTWGYEWHNRFEATGFATEADAHAAALVKGQELYPGIVPATGDENAYGALLVEDDSGV